MNEINRRGFFGAVAGSAGVLTVTTASPKISEPVLPKLKVWHKGIKYDIKEGSMFLKWPDESVLDVGTELLVKIEGHLLKVSEYNTDVETFAGDPEFMEKAICAITNQGHHYLSIDAILSFVHNNKTHKARLACKHYPLSRLVADNPLGSSVKIVSELYAIDYFDSKIYYFINWLSVQS